jgi:DNA-binding transcriptional regulator YhcF (GntR family)
VEYSDDICANKHKGAETSIAAHQRIAATSSELRQQIYSFALTSGERGITVKDVVERLKIVINTAAPRLSEMKRDGLLQIKGNERRDGCAVLIPRYATR